MKQQLQDVKNTIQLVLSMYPFYNEEREYQARQYYWVEWHKKHQSKIDDTCASIDSAFEDMFVKQHTQRHDQCIAITKYMEKLKIFDMTSKRFAHLVDINTADYKNVLLDNNRHKPVTSLQYSSAKALQVSMTQQITELKSMVVIHYFLVKHGM